MRIVLTLLLLLLVALPAGAVEVPPPAEDAVTATAAAPALAPAPDAAPAPDLRLDRVEARQAADQPAAVQDMPARGSFWWLVGVIVIAGIILAVVLD